MRGQPFAVGAVLIGEMGIKAKAGIVPMAGIDLAGSIAALGERKNWSSDEEVVPSHHRDAIGGHDAR